MPEKSIPAAPKDPRDALIAELQAKIAQLDPTQAAAAPPAEPKLFKVRIAANTASDANGRGYNTYVLMDPAKYWDRRAEILHLNTLPRSVIGTDGSVLPPQIRKRNVLVLERGGEPVEVVLCEEQLKELRSDRKNLNIFAVEKLEKDSKVKLGLVKAPTKAPAPRDEEESTDESDDLDPK